MLKYKKALLTASAALALFLGTGAAYAAHETEPNDTPQTANPGPTFFSEVSGAISSPTDLDYYKIDAFDYPSARPYIFFGSNSSDVEYELHVYEKNGNDYTLIRKNTTQSGLGGIGVPGNGKEHYILIKSANGRFTSKGYVFRHFT
ncbi:hypothetical protein QJ48_34430 [Paenibacillus sp. A3]|uniref:hypothetical protein n=1 Tax=Paenibacillus sp. A3 TaxID=1337054 RepID=UPI0006D55307|nr:hypothetical protein [Paenibacillus sp. A3]KPV55203.1 hypothetical protein QJ48_34430 [Paenibacillus sp. A3]